MSGRLAATSLVMMAASLGLTLWSAEGDKDRKSEDKPAQTAGETATKDTPAADKRVDDKDADEQASPDERAIRKIVRTMEAAFNEHNVDGVMQLFSANGEVIDAGGQVTSGREEIANIFRRLFERTPDIQMSIQIESIRVLGQNVAIEEGLLRFTENPDETETISRYAVVYTKEEGDWKMISARDLAVEAAVDNKLEQLAWLEGDWIDECEESVVTTSYRWAANGRYLVGQFKAATDEGEMQGTIQIGWDPQAKQLRSWVFDSEGGFATGLWARHEDTWVVKLSGVLANGHTTTATHRITRTTPEAAEMESRDRVIGGVLIPDADPVTMVRRGPSPESIGGE
jgi:uncharacterized protein (TIGR02246 family)